MMTPQDPHFKTRVQAGFQAQRVLSSWGATLDVVEAGRVIIGLDFREDLTQQNGFLHAGVLTTLVDSACGFAALSLMPPQSDVLAVEFKVNFIRPATGERFLAIGTALRSGKTLSVCRGTVEAIAQGETREIAFMQATMIRTTS